MVRRELDPQMRARICELSSIHWSPKEILKKHPELNLSTIKSTIRREKERINHVSKPRSGRPQGLTEEQRDHIYDTVNHTNPHIKMRDLLREVDDAVKKRSIQRL